MPACMEGNFGGQNLVTSQNQIYAFRVAQERVVEAAASAWGTQRRRARRPDSGAWSGLSASSKRSRPQSAGAGVIRSESVCNSGATVSPGSSRRARRELLFAKACNILRVYF